MTFKDRCCLSVAPLARYQWYGITLSILVLLIGMWWIVAYRSWYDEWRVLTAHVATMSYGVSKRGTSDDVQQLEDVQPCQYALSDCSQRVIHAATVLGMTVQSVAAESTHVLGNIKVVSFDIMLLGTFAQFIAYCNELYTYPALFMRRCDMRVEKNGAMRIACTYSMSMSAE